MTRVPETRVKPAVIRELEALRVAPGEVLVLRFGKDVEHEEMNLFAAAIGSNDLLRGRVVCMKFDGDMVVLESDEAEALT